MFTPSWPDWGSEAPPTPHYEKQYFTGVHGDIHAGEILYEVNGVKVLRCHPCIGIHLWPLNTSEELALYYTERFFQETKPHYLQEYAEDRDWWLAIHRTIFDAIRPLLPLSTGTPTLLDVGAGPGYPLDVGRERQYRVEALEPSPVAAEALRERGYLVHAMTLEAFVTSGQQSSLYTVLYCYEVLEHQPCPEDWLLHCYDLLIPGGVLVVVVPNDFTSWQLEAVQRYGLPYWWVAVPDHQYYWSLKTLQLCARRCGFSLCFARMTYPLIEHFILEQGQVYVNNPTLGRRCHQERVTFELDMIQAGRWSEVEAQYIANVERRYGREIIGIFTKD